MGPIIPVILIVLSLMALLAIKLFMRNSHEKNTDLTQAQISANEFINVKDIRDRFLYTRDGQIIAYIKVNPISVDLFSENEKEQMCRTLTAELSSSRKAFKFLAVSRPVDISPLISDYSNLLTQTTDQIQKQLLRNEMMVMSNYATSGEVVERQFYLMLWEKYSEGIEQSLSKRCYEFISRLENSNVACDILKEREIVRLCNLINNSADAINDEI